jgi:hypothetical protein
MREQRPAARILIADDHRLLADACKRMLEPEFAIVGIVTNGIDLMDAPPLRIPISSSWMPVCLHSMGSMQARRLGGKCPRLN